MFVLVCIRRGQNRADDEGDADQQIDHKSTGLGRSTCGRDR